MTSGYCELCGHWSSTLTLGICPECQARYQPSQPGRAAAKPAGRVMNDARLTGRDLRVLLAAFAHKDPAQGVFNAGYRTLSGATGLPVTRICEAMGRLERAGWVKRCKVGRGVAITMRGLPCA